MEPSGATNRGFERLVPARPWIRRPNVEASAGSTPGPRLGRRAKNVWNAQPSSIRPHGLGRASCFTCSHGSRSDGIAAHTMTPLTNRQASIERVLDTLKFIL
ncbi:hypothetical protein CDD83_8678 [Cordyceps sp. RAO-2017]|nr:hypothetical protein CDD83_8678 [Cordyceps sp. RAO-2017]